MATSAADTSTLEATETAFSKINKPRRKVYGSAAAEESGATDDLLINNDDVVGPNKRGAKSLFGDSDDEANDAGSATLEKGDENESRDSSQDQQSKEDGSGGELSDAEDQGQESDTDSSSIDATSQGRGTETNNSDDSEKEDAVNALIDSGSPRRGSRSHKRSASSLDDAADPGRDPSTTAIAKSSASSNESENEASGVFPVGGCGDLSSNHTPAEDDLANDVPAEGTDPDEGVSEPLTQTTDEQPEEDALIVSVDNLYVSADKETVTVKDIVVALEAEFGVKLTKKTKLFVRSHLKDLVEGTVRPNGADTDEEDDPSEEDSEPESEADVGDDDDGSDSGDETNKPKLNKKSRKGAKQQRKSTRRSTKPKKPSAVRIHAEMLRKKRIEELRVRHEELQVQQNKEDQERAELIAARFDTNTEELRMKRIEDRLDLLQKLDQKRIQVIGGIGTCVEAPIDESAEEKDIPSAIPTSDSDSDSDMELEIVGGADEPKKTSSLPPVDVKASAQSKALEILNRLGRGPADKAQELTAAKTKKKISWSDVGNAAQSSPGKSLSARAALRSTLLSKQREIGNLWLARELGYKSEQDHLRDCLEAEQKKRKVVIQQEAERLKANERKVLRERMLFVDEPVGEDEVNEEEENANTEDGRVDEEEDEEIALAKEIENETRGDGSISSDGRETVLAGSVEEAAFNDEDSVSQHGQEDDEKTVAFGNNGDDDKSVTFENEDDCDGDGEKRFVIGTDENVDDTGVMTVVAFEDDGDCHQDGDSMVVNDGIVRDNRDVGDELDDESAYPVISVNIGGGSTDGGCESHESKSDSTEGGEQNDDADAEASDQDETENVVKGSEHASENHDDDEQEEENEFDDTVLDQERTATDKGENTLEVETQEPPQPKERNSLWKEALLKEQQKMKKLKKRKGNGLVELEADEEEEDDVVAGLEDFGFSLSKKKKDGEDEEEDDDELDEEDLKHVVDDVSDDEGDEEAGELARKELMKREEKEQHKEMLRRMREGYDGRRGGIASGGAGARGLHRFDQLVAADNREDAKRLGLLNDDELDSDDEEGENDDSGKDSGEIEDETALLDKMLKDRFLHRSSVDIEENFSEDEADGDDVDEAKESQNEEDAEEREQELLAKRFAKRARMQRLIETHGQDEEFSQLRLIDEDQRMKQELMSMKAFIGPGKRQISASSASRSSFSNQGSDSQQASSSNSQSQLFATKSGSLTLAFQASRKQKNKTSFLGGSSANKEKVSAVHKAVALSHVVFHAESSQSRSALPPAASKASVPSKRKLATTTSSSLWDKVAANSFSKKTRRY